MGNQSLTVNIRYTGKNGSARAFAEEMTKSGIVDSKHHKMIRSSGNRAILSFDGTGHQQFLYQRHIPCLYFFGSRRMTAREMKRIVVMNCCVSSSANSLISCSSMMKS